MTFESVSPSAIRSIKQQDFLKVWYRLFEREYRLPSLIDFEPSRLENEKAEMMYYDIVHANGDIRYPVTFAGARLIEAYGFSAVGRDLQDVLSPIIWQHVEPIYDTCATSRRPVYSVFTVTDLKGDLVDYERLLLPFGESDSVSSMIGSIKSISVEGRIVNSDLMRSKGHAPTYHLRAVVDHLAPMKPPVSWMDDVVEMQVDSRDANTIIVSQPPTDDPQIGKPRRPTASGLGSRAGIRSVQGHIFKLRKAH